MRNIRLGRQVAREFGGAPSNAGFVCDLFGHTSQLPQIMNGFSVSGGAIWRGVEPWGTAHIIWKGVDGSQMFCYRFGRAGYCDYFWDVRKLMDPYLLFDPEEAKNDRARFLKKEADRTAIPPIIVFDGGDPLEYDDDHYRMLFAQTAGEEFPYEVVHSTLDDYLLEMLEHSKEIKDVA